jgi:hypothetical protein
MLLMNPRCAVKATVAVGLLSIMLMAAPSFPSAFQASTPPPRKSETTLRVTTRLVQASVIVQDKNGQPITGLTKDDFVLLVGGKKREISFFSVAPRQRSEMQSIRTIRQEAVVKFTILFRGRIYVFT